MDGMAGMESAYPEGCLGWWLVRFLNAWGLQEAHLAHWLGVQPTELAALAREACPAPDSPDFDAWVEAIGARYGVAATRLTYLCRDGWQQAG